MIKRDVLAAFDVLDAIKDFRSSDEGLMEEKYLLFCENEGEIFTVLGRKFLSVSYEMTYADGRKLYWCKEIKGK